MPLDAPHPILKAGDQDAMTGDGGMIFHHRAPQSRDLVSRALQTSQTPRFGENEFIVRYAAERKRRSRWIGYSPSPNIGRPAATLMPPSSGKIAPLV
jgi:hypothetical protein